VATIAVYECTIYMYDKSPNFANGGGIIIFRLTR